MATTRRNRSWLLFAVAALLACGTAFVSCAEGNETVFGTGASGAGGAGGGGVGGNACNVAACPDPQFTGLEKCCTAENACGVRSGAMGTCYASGMTSGGMAGGGGMGGVGGGGKI